MDAIPADQIRRSFVNCSKGKAKAINLPTGYDALDWERLDYLGWRDPKAPNRGYLVIPQPDGIVGVAVATAASSAPRRGSALCDLCHSAHAVTDVALFVAPRAGAAGRNGNTVGTYICADLACSLYIRGLKELELPQGDTSAPDTRATRLRDRLDSFVMHLGVPA
jgi:treble-clef zinc-finger protein